MKCLIVAIIAVAGLVILLSIGGSGEAQTIPPLDDTEAQFSQWFQTQGAVTGGQIIGRSTIDGSVIVVDVNAEVTPIVVSTATAFQENDYLLSEKLSKIDQWVSNREIELENCESNSLAGIDALNLTSWDNRSDAFRTASIIHLLECVEINSRVNRIQNNGLRDLFQTTPGLLD